VVIGCVCSLAASAAADDEPEAAQDPCANVTCSDHGKCISIGGVAQCSCYDGHVGTDDGTDCQPLPEDSAQAAGTISAGRYISGGLVGMLFGFGIGHAIHGTWYEFGWVFTLGESVGVGLFLVGLVCLAAYALEAAIGFGFAAAGVGGLAHVWGTFDGWIRGGIRTVRPRRPRAMVMPAPVLFADGGGFGLVGAF